MSRNKARHAAEKRIINRRRNNWVPIGNDVPGETLIIRDTSSAILHRLNDDGVEVGWPQESVSAELMTDLRSFLNIANPNLIEGRKLTQRLLDEVPEIAGVKIFVRGKIAAVQNRLTEASEETAQG